MAAAGSPQPNRPKAPQQAANKPLQVMKINRKDEQEQLQREAAEARAAAEAAAEKARMLEERAGLAAPPRARQAEASSQSDEERFDMGAMEGMSMADLMGSPDDKPKREQRIEPRSVDDFDFDEEAFLAALDENAPVGTTGEVIKGTVIALESDGVYVDIGGKAPGFMPKSEAGLGVITNYQERFPKGLEVEVLVTREQNADGMVTISCRALELRKSWDKVKVLEKEGKVVQVIVSGFNRGGVTCDLEGLRGFIPRSQLQDGENHQELVGKTLGVAFLEVNSGTRKLVLSEKRASVAARFQELEVGQLVDGLVASVKPYGLFIDLGGISGLLHQSAITNGSLRSIREVFDQGDRVSALITDLDPGRGGLASTQHCWRAPPVSS
jgi:small subunit ribosomal protein S1